jgi:hypothetical protein
MTMLVAALTLIAAGVLLTAIGVTPWSFDFAVPLTNGWHVTVFPPPPLVGMLVTMIGIVALLVSLVWR